MIRLRRLAIVLVAIGLVTSAIYATGAFSSLSTSRNADVSVVGDKAGYLGLTPGENGEYTTYQNGELQLRLSGALEGGDAPGGGGVNRDAETTIESVFIITNQGAQSVGVWLDDTNDAIAFERESGASLEGKGNAVQLDPGDPVAVTVRIDTRQATDDALETDLTINADQGVEGVEVGEGSSSGGSEGGQSDGESPSGKEKNDDSDNSEEDCGRWDVNCHWGNAKEGTKDYFSTDDGEVDINRDGESDREQVTDSIPDIDTSVDGKISENINKENFEKKVENISNPGRVLLDEYAMYLNEGNNEPPTNTEDIMECGPMVSTSPFNPMQCSSELYINKRLDERFFTDNGNFDPTGNGDPYSEDINSRIEGVEHFDFDGDGVSDYEEPYDTLIIPGIDHDDLPILTNFAKGGFYGNRGGPGGDNHKPNCDKWTCVSKKDANSRSYLLGQIVVGSIPFVGGASDIRDGHQNYKSENYWLMAADGAGVVIPFLGEVKPISKLITGQSKLTKVRQIRSPPSEAKNSRIMQEEDAAEGLSKSEHLKLLNDYSDGTAGKLHNKGMSVETIDKSMRKEYDLELMDKQINNGISDDHMEYYVEIGVGPPTIEKFQRSGLDSDQIKMLTEKTIEYKRNTHKNIEDSRDVYSIALNYCIQESDRSDTHGEIETICRAINPENSAAQ